MPLALERSGNHYYVIIGEEIHHADIAGRDAKAVTAELRDILATLKWELWEHMGVQSRGELPPDYAEKEFYPMFQDVKGYGIQDVIETRYRDKNTVDPETAFAHLKNLIPSRENAFLFRKD